MSLSSKLEAADKSFLLQAADPELRARAVAHLRYYRQMYLVYAVLSGVMFMGLMLLYGILSAARAGWIPNHQPPHSPISETDLGLLFGLVVMLSLFLQQMRSFSEVQNKLRLLLLAEQFYAPRNRLVVGAT